MLTRRTKAYSSSCSQTVSLSLHALGISSSSLTIAILVNMHFSGLNKIHSQLTAYTGQSVHAVS